MNRYLRQFGEILAWELKFFNKSKLLYAAVIAIVLVPVFYTGTFIMSIWDPYGNLKNLPVGIITLDKGFKYMGKPYDLGKEMVETLKGGHDFNFTEYNTEDELRKKVSAGDVYFGLVVPSDFSRKALEGTSAGIITLYTSSGTNYIAMRLALVMTQDIVDAVCDKIAVGRWRALLSSPPKAEHLARPVSYAQKDMVGTSTNGAAFTPYFMALSLWIGSLISTYLFKQTLFPRRFAQAYPAAKLAAKWFIPFMISIASATVLGVFVSVVMHIHVVDLTGYIFTLLAAVIVYSALLVSLSGAAGDIGKLIALLFLVIQIAAAGGAYPIHTSPRFYQAISLYCPLTNVVDGLRASMFGSYGGQWQRYVLYILPWLLIAMGLNIIAVKRFRYVEDDAYKPALEI